MKLTLPRQARPNENERHGFSTVVQLARYRARIEPNARAYVFLREGEIESATLTYAQLDAGARSIAALLQQRFCAGDRILLSYSPGLEFIVAFLGCLYAGMVAVPAYPPNGSSDVTPLEKIAVDAGVAGVCTGAASFNGTSLALRESAIFKKLPCVFTSGATEESADSWVEQQLARETLALLQYTSGSTGAPAGVQITHANLLHNQGLIQRSFQHSSRALSVSWLPLYHDMGLVGHVLQPLYQGITSILMAPAAFALKPVRWLQAISKYRATVSGAPDSAYELCVARISSEQMAGLDLSCWETAFSGAEAVRSETLERFARKFAACGFRRRAFFTCYGMAEATLFVTGSRRLQFPTVLALDSNALQQHRVSLAEGTGRAALSVVSCGRALEQQVLIVDPQTRRRRGADDVGEIWVRGPSVAQGYWNNPEKTRATFQAHLADTGEGPFLRTGDLGFMQRDELFVTGRLKDLIVMGGRSYYPGNIEAAVRASHPVLHTGQAAAFCVETDGHEQLVVANEIHHHEFRRARRDELMGAARVAVMSEFGLPLQDLILLRKGCLPVTSSGKVRRYASREAYLGACAASLA